MKNLYTVLNNVIKSFEKKTPLNLKDKKVLCYDYGLFTEQCSRLARDFAKVYYFVPWGDAFPHSNKALIGEGIEGLERILNFWDYVDKVDILYFPETYCGDLVEFLKNKEYKVAGVGKAELIELDRWKGRQIQKTVGLPTQKTVKIIGVENLRKYLEREKDKFVKLNIFRGDIETFFHKDYESSKPLLDHLAYDLGPKQDKVEFTVEEKKERSGLGLEPGIDCIVFDGEVLSPTMYGYERKEVGYICSVMSYEKIPKQIKFVSDRLALVFQKFRTKFFFSDEIIIANDGKGYLIDPTCRHGAPAPSAIQTELIENFSEVIYGLATSQKINPIIKYKYGAAITLRSDWALNHWLKINFPKEIRRWIKLREAVKFGGNYYAVPGLEQIGCAIALGNTIDECVNQVTERVKQVDAFQIKVDLTGIKEIQEEIEEGRKVGLNF